MERGDAIATLQLCRVDIGADFHTLNTEQISELLYQADRWHYRKPMRANVSRARYFHAFLQRKARDRKFHGFV